MSRNVARVYTYVKKSPSDEPQLAHFSHCVLKFFTKEQGPVRVECQLMNSKLVLSESDTSQGYHFDHAPMCPALALKDEKRKDVASDMVGRGVSSAVCIVLESADSEVLLTRRAKHMRTFPSVWVPPGGGIEPGETLQEAGLRELQEETGLLIRPDEIAAEHPLCLWESVYPQTLSKGLPTRHHVVLYHYFRLKTHSRDLSKNIKLERQEADAFMWATTCLAREALGTMAHSAAVPIYELDVGRVEKPSSFLVADMPPSGDDVERISTGTKFALKEWLLLKQKYTIQ